MASSVLPRHPGDRTERDRIELATVRRMLEQQRSFRIDQLARLRHTAGKGLLRGVDLEINTSLAVGARADLRDVIDALHRLDEGRYGYCAHCGAAVESERLEILPQVRLCLPCQRAAAG